MTAGVCSQFLKGFALQRCQPFLVTLCANTDHQQLVWSVSEILAEGALAVRAQPVAEQHDSGSGAGLTQRIIYQGQAVLGEFTRARHDGRGYRRQVLVEDFLVCGEGEYGMRRARIDDQGCFFIRPQGQEIGDFLFGPPQATGLHIPLLHGGRYIQQDYQGRFVLAQW